MGKGRYPYNGPKPGGAWPRVAGDTDLPGANGEWGGKLDELDVFGHSHDARYLVNESRPNVQSVFGRMFGDGRDGDKVVTGYDSLGAIKSRQYDNVIIQSGGVFYNDGPYLFIGVKNTLQIDVGGLITLSGIDGTPGATAGVGGPGGQGRGGYGGAGGNQNVPGWGGQIFGSPFATAGANGGATLGGAAGSGKTLGSINFSGGGGGGGGGQAGVAAHGGGGGGGGGANGGVGGDKGGTGVGNGSTPLGIGFTEQTLLGYLSLIKGHFGWGGGGGGGGSGGNDANASGGGGGAGGGALYIEARKIVLGVSGVLIDVSGGNGGYGWGVNRGGTGGGGGGGSCIVIGGEITNISTWRINATGGSGNAGLPPNGGNGGSGFKMIIDLSNLPGRM